MIFEGVMMAICVCVLTVAHPGLTLGAHWNTGGFHWSQKRNREVEKQHHHQPTATTGVEAESYGQASEGSSEHGGTSKERSVVKEAVGVA